jgi:DNA-binding transcriptional ArsR family regulator
MPQHDAGRHGQQQGGQQQRGPQAGPAQLRRPLVQQFVDDLGDPVIEHVTELGQELVGRRGSGEHVTHRRSAKEGLQVFFCRKTSVMVLGSHFMAMTPRRVTGEGKHWRAMSHPLRREMLRHLSEHGPANSTTLAEALGESTGTTSYHLRVLAEAGVIEEVPDAANGRERWWRTFPVDLREPDYDSLSPADRAALDEWRAQQIPAELALVNRFIRDVRKHGRWAKASRACGYYTPDELEALFDGYVALLDRYGHTREDAPPGARPVQLRMFYLPDEDAPA